MPSQVLFGRDDRVDYKEAKPRDSMYDSKLYPMSSGQDLFDQYKQDYVPVLPLSDSSFFYLYASGQVESAVFSDADNLMVKYTFVAGKEWERVYGEATGCSQQSYKSRNSNKKIVWNFPFNIAFRSTCPKGWPQITLAIFGSDLLGREVVKGYATLHLPVQPGRHVKDVRCFRPKSSSLLVQFLGYIKGKTPELIDPPRTLAENIGREVIRVDSDGTVNIVFNISQKNLESFGYSIVNS